MLKTSETQRAAVKRYAKTRKGKIAAQRYRESPEGRAAMAKAQRRYRESPKGRAAAARAQLRYTVRHAEEPSAAQRRDLRRRRIMMGLPPDLPRYTGKPFVEVSTVERLDPDYIVAALALEDLL